MNILVMAGIAVGYHLALWIHIGTSPAEVWDAPNPLSAEETEHE